MTSIRIKRTSDHGEIAAPGDSCVSCSGCGQAALNISFPPGVDEIEFSMAVQDQSRLIWNSLGKPLLGLLLAVLFAGYFELSDSGTVVAAVSGFLLGFAACVILPASLMEKKSVT